ncbi:hypothetical protein RhiirB3_434687 [Rhizophagus irregularis]|nr:hypothetical protein RhiirB3_434687 [Rhizophagus irregularis]
MDNNDGFNNDLPTTDPNSNFNYNYDNSSYPMKNEDVSQHLIPIHLYTQQQIQQVQQPIYQQNTENNIQQQFFDTTQPISPNVPHFVQNSSPFVASQIHRSEIIPFEIPGIKIIVIPTFPPMINSSQTNHSEIFTFDIPGSKVIIIILSFQ